MKTVATALIASLLGWANQRRFPTLLLITGGAFLLDLVIPDAIPFADEILLGLATAVLGSWKARRPSAQPPHSDL
ncbi:MAG: hypothetical protein HKN12_05180 [Gemmatimonadetes bacterium]|nr:hypothetical protein [Gemmatimonadota bacterium]